MAINIRHLPTDTDLSTKTILLKENMIYVGQAVSNLNQSVLYKELPQKAYKSWLWTEIKAKSNIYQALVDIKQALISKVDITLVCSCQNTINCPTISIRKAVCYLLEQEELPTSQTLSYGEFAKLASTSITDDNLHDFCVWLDANGHAEDNITYPHTWLAFIHSNLAAA